MKAHTYPYIYAVPLFVSLFLGAGSAFEFPEMDGWSRQNIPDQYNAQNLYDYIDGAADLYLRYDFRKLNVMNYENTDGAFVTIDLYEHSDDLNAFGIYSQERLPGSTRIPLGVEGYTEQGILNFLKGRYYVKVSGYGLRGDSLLTNFASLMEESIDGTNLLPREFSLFPAEGRIPGTEMYIPGDYLGHSFLQSVYTVDYKRDGNAVTLFLVDAGDSLGVRHIVESYYSITQNDGDTKSVSSLVVSLNDPYHQSDGPVHLRWEGRYIWGIYSDDITLVERLLSEVK